MEVGDIKKDGERKFINGVIHTFDFRRISTTFPLFTTTPAPTTSLKFQKHMFDRMIFAPLKDVEEIISSIAVAYSLATIGTFV